MILPKGFLKVYSESYKKNYQELISQFKADALKAEKDFFAIDFKKLFDEESQITTEATEFAVCLISMISFLPDKVRTKLLELGLGDKKNGNLLKWFISLEEIDKEINKINNISGIYIHPALALTLLYSYLKFKLFNNIIISLKKTTNSIKTGATYNSGHAGIVNYFRKKERMIKGENFSKDPYEQFQHVYYTSMQQLMKMTDKEFKNYMCSITQGKAEKIYLAQLLNSIDLVEGYSFTTKEFYLHIIDLFTLVLKDKIFYTKKEFQNSLRISDRENYDRYRVKKLQDILRSYKKN